jgi:spore coat protein U-like protein
MRKVLLTATAAAFTAWPVAADAANRSAPYNARITIFSGCLVSLGDLVFTPTAILTGTETATSTVSVTCSKHVAWSLSFSAVAPVTTTTGTMSGVTPGNTSTIAYQMKFNGNATGVGNGFVQTKTLNGKITTTGNVQADDYSQSRVLYVTY